MKGRLTTDLEDRPEMEASLTRVLRLLRMVRLFFLLVAAAFVVWEGIEVFWKGEGLHLTALIEVALISVMGPVLAWVITRYAERLAKEATESERELVALNRVLNREAIERRRAEEALRHRVEKEKLLSRELSQLHDREKRRRRQLGTLNEAGLTITSDLSLETVLQKVVDLSRQLGEARYGALSVLDDQGQAQHFVVCGLDAAQQRLMGSPPAGLGLLGAVIKEGKPIRIADIAHDPRSVGFPPNHPAMKSFLGVPIVSKGRIVGSLYLADKEGRKEFSQEDEDVILMFATHAAVAIENARLMAELTGANSNLRETLEELRDAQGRLVQSEKLAAVGELVSGVAHELNNPLTGVWGTAQLLMRRDVDENLKGDLEVIHNESARCVKIVQNLLSFARGRKSEKTRISINDAIEKTLELRAYELMVNNIEVVTELQPDLPPNMADFHQMQQVFLNIITNAEQAMTQAHGRGRLVVRTQKAGETIKIVFEDDGPGISPENLAKVFDPFFTTKGVGKGTGLGLSICYGIVKEHGGRLLVESEQGRGATFIIELPLEETWEGATTIDTRPDEGDSAAESPVSMVPTVR